MGIGGQFTYIPTLLPHLEAPSDLNCGIGRAAILYCANQDSNSRPLALIPYWIACTDQFNLKASADGERWAICLYSNRWQNSNMGGSLHHTLESKLWIKKVQLSDECSCGPRKRPCENMHPCYTSYRVPPVGFRSHWHKGFWDMTGLHLLLSTNIIIIRYCHIIHKDNLLLVHPTPTKKVSCSSLS